MKRFRTSKILASGLVAALFALSFGQAAFAEGESLKDIFRVKAVVWADITGYVSAGRGQHNRPIAIIKALLNT